MPTKTIAIRDIKPNPFRHMDRYPIRPEKIEALRASMRATGFWDNIVGRLKNGAPQIAYGHHRYEALKQEFGPDYKIELIIRDLDDATMIKVMANENMEDWASNALVDMETVAAVVEAYAQGHIKLDEPKTMAASVVRYAPSFSLAASVTTREPVPSSSLAYSVDTIARFIGWTNEAGLKRVATSLNGLELIEQGHLTHRHFEDLLSAHAEALVKETRAARDRREAAAKFEARRAAKAAEDAEKERIAAQEKAERDRLAAERVEVQRREAERIRKEKEAEAEKERKAEKAAREERERKQAKARREAAEREAEKRRQEEARLRELREERERTARETEAAKAKAERAALQAANAKQATAERAAKAEAVAKAETGRIGAAVVSHFRSGGGKRDARDAAMRAEAKGGKVPPDLNDFTDRIANQIARILMRDKDKLFDQLTEIVKFRVHLPDAKRINLAKTVRKAGERFIPFADELMAPVQKPVHQPSQARLTGRK